MGYIIINILGRPYLAHRLAWYIARGTWPSIIDHINGDPGDNRIANLRPTTTAQNQINRRPKQPPKSGHRGVYPNGRGWFARIAGPDNKPRYLGTFPTKEEASAAYQNAMREYYGELSPFVPSRLEPLAVRYQHTNKPPTPMQSMAARARRARQAYEKPIREALLKTPLSHSALKAALEYNPHTGTFTRLISCRGMRRNTRSGTIAKDGREYISIGRTKYAVHRLAWFYMTGEWPVTYVDHINGDHSDNRWANLRQATASENGANRRLSATNKAQLKGVRYRKGKYDATITVNKKQIHLGRFQTAEAAHAAYCDAAKHYYGAFARAA